MRTLLWAVLIGGALASQAGAGDLGAAINELQSGNCEAGLKHLKEIAATGDAVAEYDLGYTYRHGICVAQNDATAFKWYLAAARHGLSDAQDQVGWMYANGIGVKQDLRQSVIWSAASAAQGNRHARDNLAAACSELGWSHLGGVGGYPQDFFWSYVWFSLAKENGHTDAETYLDVTRNGPEGPQIEAQADKAIRKCIASDYRDCG